MKKNLWMLGMAVAALTSCTQSEVMNVPESRLIGFDAFVDKETREASGPIIGLSGTTGLMSFNVIGYEDNELLFNNTTVARANAESSIFTYSPHQVWAPNCTYNFSAYSDGNKSITLYDSSTMSGSTAPSVEFNKTNSTLIFRNYTEKGDDLLANIVPTIETDGTVSDMEAVDLNFSHLLSRLRFSLQYEGANTGSVSLTAFGVTLKNKGNCTFTQTSGAVWSDLDANKTYNVNLTEKVASGGAPISQDFFIIPQSHDVDVSFELVSYDAQNHEISRTSHTVSLALTMTGHAEKWQPGYIYNYIISASAKGTEIHFSPEVTNWHTQNVYPSTSSSN